MYVCIVVHSPQLWCSRPEGERFDLRRVCLPRVLAKMPELLVLSGEQTQPETDTQVIINIGQQINILHQFNACSCTFR